MDNYELVALEMSSTHVTEHWKAKPEPEPPVLKPNEPELPAMKKPAVSKGVLKKPASSRRAFQRATEKKAAAVTARPAKETAKAKAKAKASKTSEHQYPGLLGCLPVTILAQGGELKWPA